MTGLLGGSSWKSEKGKEESYEVNPETKENSSQPKEAINKNLK